MMTRDRSVCLVGLGCFIQWVSIVFPLAAKGDFINAAGLKGFAMWHVAGDYKNILLNSINDAIDSC
jgi:hypothetical protein